MTLNRAGMTAMIVISTLLFGCATMSPEECKRADWMDIGLRDGLSGRPLSMFDDRANDCRKAGSAVDTGRYMTGREKGLQTFCRLENAAPLGLSGADYAGVCPPLIDIEFRRRYQIGHAVFALRSEVSGLDSRSEGLQHKLREADRDEDKRLREASKDEDRRNIRKEFDERRHRLRDELADLDRKVRRARDALRDAEFTLDRMR